VVERRWYARVRGPALVRGWNTWIGLESGQPLLLEREPNNPKDANAILVRDLFGAAAGYIERRVAAQVAPVMDSGVMVMAKIKRGVVHAPGVNHPPVAMLWTEHKEDKVTTSRELETT